MTTTTITPEQIQALIGFVNQTFPNWQGFSDPRFEEAEITYKQAAVQKARELLDETVLRDLIAQEKFDEFTARLVKVAQAGKNLLYLSAPNTGDLSVLYQENLDKKAFGLVFIDLIHGKQPSSERLSRFSDFLKQNKMPNKWAFATYFLAIMHPATELFVKPMTTDWFLKFVGYPDKLPASPTQDIYSSLLDLCHQMWDALQDYHPRDFIDIQSIIWVSYYANNKMNKLAAPFNKMFQDWDEAEWAFDLFEKAADNLGVLSPSDPLISVTCSKITGGQMIRLNYGNWMILGVNGSNQMVSSVHISLFEGQLDLPSIYEGVFKQQPENQPRVILYELAIDDFKQNQSAILKLFKKTMQYVASRFKHWKSSGFRRYNNDQLAAAFFQQDVRKKILSEGLKLSEELDTSPLIEQEITEEIDAVDTLKTNPTYTLEQFADETGMEISELARWVRAVQRKKQVILYGPPGTGKTFIADKFARFLTSGGDGITQLVQFHPEVSYEDFIQGIRPQQRPEGGLDYPVVPGRFMEFCKEAGMRKDTCVLIIDEINRANLARVFGELMYLLEYRNQRVALSAGNEFEIPENVRIIGTMNTADRSIALVDHALRRRFAMLPLYPNYEILKKYHQREQTGFSVEGLISVLERLNTQIADKHYAIGTSYFLRPDIKDHIQDIWQMEIEPYIDDYFFDRPQISEKYSWNNNGIASTILK